MTVSFSQIPNDSLKDISNYITEPGDLKALSLVEKKIFQIFKEKLSGFSEQDFYISAVQRMFIHFEGNQWGIHDGEQFACLACLKCNKVFHDYKEFIKWGPGLCKNIYFCKEDGKRFTDNKLKLFKYSSKNRLNEDNMWKISYQPIDIFEEKLKSSAPDIKNYFKHLPQWQMLPFVDPRTSAEDYLATIKNIYNYDAHDDEHIKYLIEIARNGNISKIEFFRAINDLV